MEFFYVILDIFQCDSAYTAYCSCKVAVDHILGNSDCLKDLRSLIGLDGGNTHLGSDLYDTADNRMIVIINRCIVIFVQHMGIDEFMDGIQCQVWIDSTCAITKKCCEMMYFSRFTGLQDQRKGCTLLCFYKVLMHCGNSKKRRDRHMVLIYATVRKDQDICALTESLINLYEQAVNGTFQFCTLIIQSRNGHNLEAVLFHVLDLQHIGVCQDRVVDFKNLAVLRILNKKVSVFSYVYTCRSNDLLTDCIDRRVCYLCKKLFEVIEQRIMFLGKYCKRSIMSHSSNAL